MHDEEIFLKDKLRSNSHTSNDLLRTNKVISNDIIGKFYKSLSLKIEQNI